MVSTATAQKKSYMVVKRLKMIGTNVPKSKQASSIQAEKDLIEGKERVVWGYVLRSVRSYYTTPLNSSLGASVST